MASPFEELNAFNLQQLARSGQPLQRLGEAQIGLAQYQLERQAQQQDDERRRRGRVADALTIYGKQTELQAKRQDEQFKKTIEREAAALGVDTDGKDVKSLLRETKLAQQAEVDRMDFEKVVKELNTFGHTLDPKDPSLNQAYIRALLGDAREQRRLTMIENETRTRAETEDAIRTERFTRDLPMIKQTLVNIEDEADEEEQRIHAVVSQDPVPSPERVRRAFFESGETIAALGGLKPDQANLLKKGDLNDAIEQLAKKNPRTASLLAMELAKARNAEKVVLLDQKDKEVLILKATTARRRFDKTQALFNKYGPDVLSLTVPRLHGPPVSGGGAAEGTFKLPPPGAAAPAPTGAAIAPPGANYTAGIFPTAMQAVRSMPVPSLDMAPIGAVRDETMSGLGTLAGGAMNVGGNIRSGLFGGPMMRVPDFDPTNWGQRAVRAVGAGADVALQPVDWVGSAVGEAISPSGSDPFPLPRQVLERTAIAAGVDPAEVVRMPRAALEMIRQYRSGF